MNIPLSMTYQIYIDGSLAQLKVLALDQIQAHPEFDDDGNQISGGDEPSRVLRVANEYDRQFARLVHEMCLQWAQAYSSENLRTWEFFPTQ